MNENNETSYEREMARINNSAVLFNNIDDEDFTHSFDGIPYTVKTGEKQIFTYPVGNLLARHLAKRILRKRAVASGAVGDKDKTGRAIVMYTETKILELVAKILENKYERPLPKRQTPGEIEKARTEQMRAEFGDKLKDDKPPVTKKDVIEELKKRKITFDPRKSRDELLAILTQSETDDVPGEEDGEEEDAE